MKILINDATVVTSSGVFRRSVLIEDGMITGVSAGALNAKHAGCVIEDKELLVFPGFLDMHVHLREPGYEYKEDIISGMTAAHHGGFTAIACMANTNPVNDNTSVTRFIINKARSSDIPVDVHPIAAITKGQKGESLVEMAELKDAGAVAFSDDGRPVENPMMLRRAMEYAQNFNTRIICHSEDRALSANGQIHEGVTSLRLGLEGIPREAEISGIFRDLALARLTGTRVHIAHVSTREGVDLIRRAKKDGARVTCETCPQYFTLTDEAVADYNTLAKVNPPLRTKDDIAAIREGLKSGVIDVIASDHAPHHMDEKNVEFDKAAFGMIGLETMVPLTLELVREGVMDFNDMAEKLSRKPHQILGLKPPAIKEGEQANMTIIDPAQKWILTHTAIHSKSKNTPFLGRRMTGKAKYVIKRGGIFEV